jgi:hypothetical protein
VGIEAGLGLEMSEAMVEIAAMMEIAELPKGGDAMTAVVVELWDLVAAMGKEMGRSGDREDRAIPSRESREESG